MRKYKVLLIEDEQAIADTIIYALSSDGIETVHLLCGADALSLLESNTIDLLVLDIGLPDINGFELLKNIRQHYTLPVLILTARSEEVDKVVGLELGADDYITKPFSPRELSARVKANLRRIDINAQTKATDNQFFSHDENRKLISYCNKALELSFYEYKILALLLKKPGWVFSRNNILDMVWDDEGDVYDRTVDAHIKAIRSKLRSVREDYDPIETHRGFGYSLKDAK